MLDPRLTVLADGVARLLRERGDTIGVAESSCGGLISASLLAVPGASAYFVGGAVVYSRAAGRAFLAGAGTVAGGQGVGGMRAETEEFALYMARSTVEKLDVTWAVGETGAAGPSGSPYGDPAGHVWVAVTGPAESTRHVLTGSADRPANMVTFAEAALGLLAASLEGTWPHPS